MRVKSQNVFALVIKVKNSRENDLLVTLLTQEKGKVMTVAKGVRKLTSSKRAFLEPGNLIKTQLVETKSWPILTQAQLVEAIGETRNQLKDLRRLFLYLEIIDLLMTEEELTSPLFKQILYLRAMILQKVTTRKIKNEFKSLLGCLGFIDEQKELVSVSAMVNEITGGHLRTFEYLRVEE